MTDNELDAGGAVAWLSEAFKDGKTLFEHSIGFHNDALHVLAGVVIQIGAALLFRKSLAHWTPWLAVLLLELANEANDLATERWPQPAMQMGEGLKDVALTMALPTLLFAAVRWKQSLFAAPTEKTHG